MTKIITVNPANPEETHLDQAARIIQTGGVVAFPTETFYGLGASALNGEAVKKIFSAKERDLKKPLLVLIYGQASLFELVSEVPDIAFPLMKKFWPGALTIIFKASAQLPPILTGGTGSIGIRISSNLIAQKLVQRAGIPITATSANREGGKNPSLASHVAAQLGDNIDLIINGGKTEGEIGSTIIDITSQPPHIVREGEINRREIEKLCSL